MNWSMFFKTLAHALLGGVAVAVAQQVSAGGPITSGTALLPVAASAVTSVVSALSQSPLAPPVAK